MEAFVVKSFPSLLIIVLVASSAVTEKLSVESENVMTVGAVADTKLSTENKNALNNGQTPSTENRAKEDYNPDVTRIRRVSQLLPENISLYPDQQCYTQFFVNRRPPVGLRNATSENVKYICQPGKQQTYYATMFDEGLGIAVYSAYTLTPTTVKFKKGRPPDTWIPTPGIKKQGSAAIYLKSGYHRGHLFASKTALFKLESAISTFKYTNAVPQRPHFNRVVWRDYEKKIRGFGKKCTGASLNGVLYLLTGGSSFIAIQGVPLQAKAAQMQLLSTIAIPNSMWTAGMCVPQSGNAQSFAVIGNNVQEKVEILPQQVTLAKLEEFLGLKSQGQVQVELFPGIANSVNVDLNSP